MIEFVSPVYRDEDHTYGLDGKKIPGFSEIAKAEGLIQFGGIPQSTLDHARDRGRSAHLACHFLDQGVLDRESVHPEIAGYLAGYEKFKKDHGVEVVLSEQPMANRTHWFACTPDKVGVLDGLNAVVDIKTGVPAPWHGIQLAAQALCLPAGYKRFGLYLEKDGSYLLKAYTDRTDRDLWVSTVNLHNWKFNNI